MTDPLKLASEFPSADYAAWRTLAEEALKGASFEKKLVTKTLDGFALQPLYTKGDQDADTRLIHDVLSASVEPRETVAGWDIRQLHTHPDPIVTNAAILDDLENGATSILLKLDAAARKGREISSGEVGVDGIAIHCLADLECALSDVYTNLATIALDGGAAAIPAAAMLAARMTDEDGASEAAPAFNIDPIGTLASTGTLPCSTDDALRQTANITAELIDLFPMGTAISVNGAPYYNAGATDGQELACLLASGVAYLRALTDTGMAVDQAAGAMAFNVAIGTDFFAGIAKLRALRLMWTRILAASGAEDASISINAVSAEMAMSKVDPWVNMLRTTVTSFAAGLGGADSVVCLPYDHLIGLPDGFTRRIARNTQLILQEESNVHRVIDPAGGAWFIENMTRDLAKAAWAKFQSLEASGGIVAALANGSLKKDIEAVWHTREERVANRRDPLTGVSEFPNISETKVTCDAPDLDAIQTNGKARQTKYTETVGATLSSLMEAARKGATIGHMYTDLYGTSAATTVPALTPHRLSEPYETLRKRADGYKTKTGTFPQIFLANLGKVAQHTARAMFARNFFEAGGIEAITNTGFADAKSVAKAFTASGAKIAVICGSDPQYGDMAADVARTLKTAGASLVYLAGHPGDARAGYEAAGIDDFIYVGTDVPDICRTAMDHLSGARGDK
ncbi:methylmalonyl-CoA mutase family protein [Thalassospira lucentensis]|uniref:methylmalonyl-CoA mutase family protein n=1 Tax=Thalassospira lucentensis TaxID=168935 RepID=UPI0003B59C78|nr:methylmalonyl-CoA mutase family protein [Thalassospira lucentensis]RCK30800.1 methylmalonyl-CoA mutase [Thalassospira lucentensis MCCC 1A00383 = DSM 14000]